MEERSKRKKKTPKRKYKNEGNVSKIILRIDLTNLTISKNDWSHDPPLCNITQQPKMDLNLTSTLVLDSGGWTIKHNLIPPLLSSSSPGDHNVSPNLPATKSIPNAIAIFGQQMCIGDEIYGINNKAKIKLISPIERGYVTDLGTQFKIWNRILMKQDIYCSCNYSGGGINGIFDATVAGNKMNTKNATFTHLCSVLLLHQPLTPRSMIEKEDIVWFRNLGFSRVARRLGVCCSAHRYLSMLEKMTPQQSSTSIVKEEPYLMKVKGEQPPLWKQDEMKVKDRTDITNSRVGNSLLVEGRNHQHTETNGVIDDGTRCCCVVDSGFSFTHIVPTEYGKAIGSAIRRINIGGKILTNLLKETVSYRQWNMADEYYIINEAKEALSFVSMDFDKELALAQLIQRGLRWYDREFVLPDYLNTFKSKVQLPVPLRRLNNISENKKHGCEHYTNKKSIENVTGDIESDHEYIKNTDETFDCNNSSSVSDDKNILHNNQTISNHVGVKVNRRIYGEEQEQSLLLSVERFSIPEILFRPQDIGIDQLGLAEAIVQSIDACKPKYHAAMYHNIVLTGGNFKIPYLAQRLEKELRSIVPSNYAIRIYVPDDVINYAWKGARDLLRNKDFVKNEFIHRIKWESYKKYGKSIREVWTSI